MIERFIDYLQFTIPLSESYARNEAIKTIAPIQFYKRGYQYDNGTRIYYGNPNSNRGLVILSGQTLQSHRDLNVSDEQILGAWIDEGASFSRMDIAVTEWIENSLVTVNDVGLWWRAGLIKSPLAEYKPKLMVTLNEWDWQHETLYIGNMKNRSKTGIFRAYDKGIEQGIGGEIATRLELELRREKADWGAKKIAQGETLSGVFRHRFDVEHEDFNRLMDSPAIVVQRGKANENKQSEQDEKMDKRFEWLMQQIAPAIREFVDYEDSKQRVERIERFIISAGLSKEMIRGAKWYSQKSQENSHND